LDYRDSARTSAPGVLDGQDMTANQITGANVGGPRLLAIRMRWAAHVAQFRRSPKMRARHASEGLLEFTA